MIPDEPHENALELLILLDEAQKLEDFWLFPSTKLKKVQGTKNVYELRVHNKYRLYFEWEQPDAYKVKIGDHL